MIHGRSNPCGASRAPSTCRGSIVAAGSLGRQYTTNPLPRRRGQPAAALSMTWGRPAWRGLAAGAGKRGRQDHRQEGEGAAEAAGQDQAGAAGEVQGAAERGGRDGRGECPSLSHDAGSTLCTPASCGCGGRQGSLAAATALGARLGGCRALGALPASTPDLAARLLGDCSGLWVCSEPQSALLALRALNLLQSCSPAGPPLRVPADPCILSLQCSCPSTAKLCRCAAPRLPAR